MLGTIMNNMALKRWLVLGGLLALTLYLAWQSPRPETESVSTLSSNNGVVADDMQSPARRPSAERAPTNQSAVFDKNFRFAPRTQVVHEVVDLFAPVVPPRPQASLEPAIKQAAPAPQAPPLPFTFVGRISEADGVKIFLQADNVLYSPKVGEVFAQQYRLTGAENGKLSIAYLPLNITQTMFYGETP
jgi:hypothetical protein